MSGVDALSCRVGQDGASARPDVSVRDCTVRAGVQRVSSPRRFRALQSSSIRARSGPLRVSWAPHDSVLSVAYAIPTSVGNAVVRNTVRRRLRSIFAETSGQFPAGDLLVRVVGAGQRCTWSVLQSSTASICTDLVRRCDGLTLVETSSQGSVR